MGNVRALVLHQRSLRVLGLGLCALALSGCGLVEAFDKNAKNAKKACTTAAPAARLGTPKLLPATFPTPDRVTYVAERKDGPTTIIEGFHLGSLTDLYDAYREALSTDGWNVTKDEHDAADAEVNFASTSRTGQVKLLQECLDRTKITLTIRPA